MYKFNLEPLLNHRRYQEEILQKELAESKMHLAEAQHKLKSRSANIRMNFTSGKKKTERFQI